MSLKRVLEPEVMDSPAEARDYNAMDHANVNRAFVTDFLSFIGQEELADVLDVGTGTALIPIELCQQNSDCRIMAIDMAVSMLDLARYNIEAAGFIEQITLAQVDAKAMKFDDGMFDAVICNTIVHHIPNPLDCLQEIVRVTDEDSGVIFIRDLMRPDDESAVNELVNAHAGKEKARSRQMLEDSLYAALSLEEIQELVVGLGFDRESVQPTSDRHWTWAVRR